MGFTPFRRFSRLAAGPLVGLLAVPLPAGCFASEGGGGSASREGGSRLRVALAFPPAERLSPYGADAALLSRLGVTEGLTALDANGSAVPALAEFWQREGARMWTFSLREAVFQDGTKVTPDAVVDALTHAARAEPAPAALTGVDLTAEADGDRAVRVVTAVAGRGPATPALAVGAVAWAPLAAHTSALPRQERATPHITATRALGAGRRYLLRHELLPAVLPPVVRHALLRLPGIALALASLTFLGLGAQPPSPEWGLLLAENQPYAERAPWAVLAPAAVLALLGALAVTAARGRHGGRAEPTR
ncbi:ABC transporter permease subunit [Streptomyces sp. NPDC052687]|uniref:ABC transporter permease subunit n=1 Tax=Streptomyces sp. NPDC052687 TaxID=3154759 RepID=UPI003434C113